MNPSQEQKGRVFQALHERPGCFVIPNSWDVGTTRLLTNLGFEAIGTTSAGLAFSLGRRDGEGAISRDEVLANARAIVAATHLPVSAAVESARKLPFPFLITARAENFLYGRPDLNDTIRRLQAYQDAGADVLYAPGLRCREDIATVVRSIDRPLNVVMGLKGVTLSIAELTALGVKRVSLGSALNRAALGEFLRAAREIMEHGTFSFTEGAVSFDELNETFRLPSESPERR